jgi:type IV pilus assembly protein PilC
MKLSIKEQALLAKRLSFLIKAHIPLLESLEMIKAQTISKRYNLVLASVVTDISGGQLLSTSLAKFRQTFGDFAINIISVGEASGSLSENLEYLADELKKKQVLQRKLVAAFIYPVIVTLATLGITAFLMIYLFPKIMPVFTSLNIELPLSTRIVIGLSNFIRHWGWLTLSLVVITTIGLTIYYRKSEKFRFYGDRMLLGLPIVGRVIRSYNLANLSRTLGLLLKSGLTLSDAIPITGNTIENLVYKTEFKSLALVDNRGEMISSYFAQEQNLFTNVLAQLVSVGERSGSLSSSLTYASELYEAEVDDFTKNLSSLIEPILMIFMGLIVGFIAISIITPIYGITQHLQAK